MRRMRCRVSCASFDEFTFVFPESAPDQFVVCLKDWLREYIKSGAEIHDGETLQYGFTIFFCRVKSRTLSLLAPDFKAMPISWVPSLGRAMQIIAAHKYTPETFGFTPDIPCLLNTALVGEKFDELPMFMNRLTPIESNPNDSGWFIGSRSDEVDNNDPDSLRLMSLYEVVLAVPRVLRFLSLPVDCQVLFSGGRPVVLHDYEELEIPKGSYLDRVFQSEEGS